MTQNAACWRQRLRECMAERGLTQMDFVSELNRQYLTKFHQRDVSRWLNTGNHSANGVIGFPKYETMTIIADFFGVDVGYLTGETNERSFDLAKACKYIGLDAQAVESIRVWVHNEQSSDAYHADTLNRLFSADQFPVLAEKLVTLNEMATVWRCDPERFTHLISSVAGSEEYSSNLTFKILVGAFYGMANETFAALLRQAYSIPSEREFLDTVQDLARDDD